MGSEAWRDELQRREVPVSVEADPPHLPWAGRDSPSTTRCSPWGNCCLLDAKTTGDGYVRSYQIFVCLLLSVTLNGIKSPSSHELNQSLVNVQTAIPKEPTLLVRHQRSFLICPSIFPPVADRLGDLRGTLRVVRLLGRPLNAKIALFFP